MPFLQKCRRCKLQKPCINGVCQSCTTPEERQAMYDKQKEKLAGYRKKYYVTKAYEKKEPTGEWELFVKIWLERPHVCTGCDEKLYVMTASLFSHTVRTAEDESLRLVKENIEIECVSCHGIWDQGTWDKIIKQKNFVKRMKYIKSVRPDLFERKALKILDYTGVDVTLNLINEN